MPQPVFRCMAITGCLVDAHPLDEEPGKIGRAAETAGIAGAVALGDRQVGHRPGVVEHRQVGVDVIDHIAEQFVLAAHDREIRRQQPAVVEAGGLRHVRSRRDVGQPASQPCAAVAQSMRNLLLRLQHALHRGRGQPRNPGIVVAAGVTQRAALGDQHRRAPVQAADAAGPRSRQAFLAQLPDAERAHGPGDVPAQALEVRSRGVAHRRRLKARPA